MEGISQGKTVDTNCALLLMMMCAKNLHIIINIFSGISLVVSLCLKGLRETSVDAGFLLGSGRMVLSPIVQLPDSLGALTMTELAH